MPIGEEWQAVIAKKLRKMRKVLDLKEKLRGEEGKEQISYSELLDHCCSLDIGKSPDEGIIASFLFSSKHVYFLFSLTRNLSIFFQKR